MDGSEEVEVCRSIDLPHTSTGHSPPQDTQAPPHKTHSPPQDTQLPSQDTQTPQDIQLPPGDTAPLPGHTAPPRTHSSPPRTHRPPPGHTDPPPWTHSLLPWTHSLPGHTDPRGHTGPSPQDTQTPPPWTHSLPGHTAPPTGHTAPLPGHIDPPLPGHRTHSLPGHTAPPPGTHRPSPRGTKSGLSGTEQLGCGPTPTLSGHGDKTAGPRVPYSDNPLVSLSLSPVLFSPCTWTSTVQAAPVPAPPILSSHLYPWAADPPYKVAPFLPWGPGVLGSEFTHACPAGRVGITQFPYVGVSQAGGPWFGTGARH
ncbi:uncharacterized protein LOC129046226 [Mirounga angustirostris]|uniref:uncharacterized protein LOC129046226 n=1 Tax=Mirounga angustirostris TaxID=9716 RepID=UPI00313D9861